MPIGERIQGHRGQVVAEDAEHVTDPEGERIRGFMEEMMSRFARELPGFSGFVMSMTSADHRGDLVFGTMQTMGSLNEADPNNGSVQNRVIKRVDMPVRRGEVPNF